MQRDAGPTGAEGSVVVVRSGAIHKSAVVAIALVLAVATACSDGNDDPSSAPTSSTTTTSTTAATGFTTPSVPARVLVIRPGEGETFLLDPATGDVEPIAIPVGPIIDRALPTSDGGALVRGYDDGLAVVRAEGGVTDLGIDGTRINGNDMLFTPPDRFQVEADPDGSGGIVVIDTATAEVVESIDGEPIRDLDHGWVIVDGGITLMKDPSAVFDLPADEAVVGPNGQIAWIADGRVTTAVVDLTGLRDVKEGPAVPAGVTIPTLLWAGDRLVATGDGTVHVLGDGAWVEVANDLGGSVVPVVAATERAVVVESQGPDEFQFVDLDDRTSTPIGTGTGARSDRWWLSDVGDDGVLHAVSVGTGDRFEVALEGDDWTVDDVRGRRALLFSGCGEPGLVVDLPTGEQFPVDDLCTGRLSPDGERLAWSDGEDDGRLRIGTVDRLDEAETVATGFYPATWIGTP